MEIPSSHAGVVKELKIAVGDKVGEGSLLLVLDGRTAPAAAPAPALRACSMAPAAAPAPAPALRPPQRQRRWLWWCPTSATSDEVAVIELFVKAGRHGQAGAEPDHRRERQGLDGDSVQPRRRRGRAAGQARRQGRQGRALDGGVVGAGRAGSTAAAQTAPVRPAAGGCRRSRGSAVAVAPWWPPACRPRAHGPGRQPAARLALASASSPASSACRWPKSRVPAPRAASPRPTFRPS